MSLWVDKGAGIYAHSIASPSQFFVRPDMLLTFPSKASDFAFHQYEFLSVLCPPAASVEAKEVFRQCG
jgi:hypothetical protein